MSILLCAALYSCDTVDCPINNIVNMHCTFYSDGKIVKLTDTLTVKAMGTDSILLNKAYDVKSISLPLSYTAKEDTFLLEIKGEDYQYVDTLTVTKKSTPHFESPDCPANMFHQILGTSHTSVFIRSVSITKPEVNYEERENLQIGL